MINHKEIITNKENFSQIINEDYLNWYLIYCHECDGIDTHMVENHHVLPKGIFPEYRKFKDFPWNKVKIGAKNHFVAHFIAMIAFNTPSTSAAFNIMRRTALKCTEQDLISLDSLYAASREFQSKAMKFYKKDAKEKVTPEFRQHMSDLTAGTVIVRHKDEAYGSPGTRMSTTDERYLSGEYIFVNTGSKHSDSTKQLMSENGIKGKKTYYSEIEKKKLYLSDDEDIPEGYTLGDSNASREVARKRFTESSHWHNPITGEEIRSKTHLETPWIKGRLWKSGNIFSTSKQYMNYETGTRGYCLKELDYPKYCGAKLAKFAFVYKGHVAFNSKNLSKIFEDITSNICMLVASANIEKRIKIRHGYLNHKVSRDYLSQFDYWDEIGLQIFSIRDFMNLDNYRDFIWIG